LRLLLVDPGQPTPDVELEANDLRVVVKADLYPEQGRICSLTGEGLPELMEKIHGILSQRAASAGVLVRDRHRQAIKDAISALDLVLGSLYARTDDLELVAEDLHRARRALERLVGRIDIEDLLGEIFSSFCIGK
jgi:tRNA modification GTPase